MWSGGQVNCGARIQDESRPLDDQPLAIRFPIKRVTRPMLNFKSFLCANCVLAGIELIHMIRKGQFSIDGADAMLFAEQFSALAGMVGAK